MYPLKESQPYPQNQWWIAAHSTEVGRALLARTFLDQRTVLYRKEDGTVAAVSGVCPHRMYPLKAGRLVGDEIQCGYHGLKFNSDGACTHAPSQSDPPARGLRLRSYPTLERGGLVWIWMGAPEKADPALAPDVGAMGLGVEGWQVEYHPVAHIRGRYTLLIDNLMDLSHVTFLHADTIPNADAVASLPVQLVNSDTSLCAQRKAMGIASNPYLKSLFPDHDGGVDQHFDAEYFGPCLIRTGGVILKAGTSDMLGVSNFVHGMTPETPHSTHYFVMTTRNFSLKDDMIGKMNIQMGARIQPQDVDAIEMIETELANPSGLPEETSCIADAGALQVRRRLDAQIRDSG